jgi:glutamine cyclotransferase
MTHSALTVVALLSCAAVLILLVGLQPEDQSALASGPGEVHIQRDGLAPRVISVTLASSVCWINETEVTVTIAAGPLFCHYLPLVVHGSGWRMGTVNLGHRAGRPAHQAFGAVLGPGRVYTHTFHAMGRHPYHVTNSELGMRLRGAVYVEEPPPNPTPRAFTYQVIHEYPHDPDAFTQGLVFDDGCLYEGTGLWGESSLRRVDLETGEVLQIHELEGEYFGEGIAVFAEDRIAQITWKAETGFVYDKESFDLLEQFEYETEGWGLTYDGETLIMSDGTATLHFLDPETFEEVSTVVVQDPDGPVTLLNELEYVNGKIYANVWYSDRVAIIDPGTGWVTGWINLQGLLSPEEAEDANVLNGIAYDAAGDRLFVTGKWWPKLFEIQVVPLLPRADSRQRGSPRIVALGQRHGVEERTRYVMGDMRN